MYAEPIVHIELKEYNELKDTIAALKYAGEGEELTPIELKEAVGLLLVKALRNPALFQKAGRIPMGKYMAMITFISMGATTRDDIQVLVQLSRNPAQ